MKNIIKINSLFQSNGWTSVKALREFDDNCLTEDLAQYEKNGVIIDFGFYGDETTPSEGEYRIYIIFGQNWENYFAKFCFKSRELAFDIFERLPSMNFSVD